MSKHERAIKLFDDLRDTENNGYEFNEFPQLCEDTLRAIIPMLSGRALDYVINQFESNSK